MTGGLFAGMCSITERHGASLRESTHTILGKVFYVLIARGPSQLARRWKVGFLVFTTNFTIKLKKLL